MRRPHVRVIRVIEVEFNRGEGVEGDPVRRVYAYHDFDGRLLAEYDPWTAPHDNDRAGVRPHDEPERAA